MDAHHCNVFARFVNSSFTSRIKRRFLLGRVMAAGAAVLGGAMLPESAAAKKKKRSKTGKGDLCLSNGSRCKKKGKKCKAGNCLKTPFTIEAHWSSNIDHDTYVFVPNAPGASQPSPYIGYDCDSARTNAGTLYPFAFVSQDATGPGDEVTMVKKLLAGTYEHWIDLEPAPAGDLTVTLRNANGKVVRSWDSPANPDSETAPWHVFDIQGPTKRITSIDELPGSYGHDGNTTDVCP
jgi:hypothetical protein